MKEGTKRVFSISWTQDKRVSVRRTEKEEETRKTQGRKKGKGVKAPYNSQPQPEKKKCFNYSSLKGMTSKKMLWGGQRTKENHLGGRGVTSEST